MTMLAFQNPELLRALADPALTFEGPKALADHLARDKSNTHRALKGLREDGIVDGLALTDLGRRILAGIDVAEGRQAASGRDAGTASDRGPQTWPLDRIIRNPANRQIDPAGIPGMADSLAAQGQLQPITLTPVRDDGMRMLLIGERRWLGAVMAAEQGRLPESLADGLRFEEREATPAEALAITLIENSERQDIPPLEEAFLLRDLADALGFNGKEVADHLGRKPRDVQDKIRIARNASPEALAAYAGDGSWDRLRDSVTDRKAGGGTPLSLEGRGGGGEGAGADHATVAEDIPCEGFSAATQAAAIERALAGYPDAENQRAWVRQGNLAGHTTAEGELWPENPTETLTPLNHPKLPTATIHLSVSSQGRWTFSTRTRGGPPNYGGQTGPHGPFSGELVYPTRHDALRAAELEVRRRIAVSKALDAWLSSLTTQAEDPLIVNGVHYPNLTRANEARRDAGILPRHSNSGGGHAGPTQVDRHPGEGRDQPLPLAQPGQPGLSPNARLALIEIAHKTAEQPRPITPTDSHEWTGDPDRDFAAFGAAAGKFWLDPAFNELQALRLVRAVMQTDQPPIIILTPEGVAWFGDNAIALPVTEQAVIRAQADVGIVDLGAARYAAEWLRNEAAPSPGVVDAIHDAHQLLTADLYDRTPDQIAADADLLARVRAFADQDQPTPDGADFPSLWAELGLASEVVITESGNGVLVQLTDGSPPVEILTADARLRLPDDRADAVAWLTAWAIEQALGGGSV